MSVINISAAHPMPPEKVLGIYLRKWGDECYLVSIVSHRGKDYAGERKSLITWEEYHHFKRIGVKDIQE